MDLSQIRHGSSDAGENALIVVVLATIADGNESALLEEKALAEISVKRVTVAVRRWSIVVSDVKRILVVDDFGPFRSLVGSILTNRAGWQIVAEATDGLDAIEKARALQPELILLDIALPKMNGIQVAKEISRITPASKIIFLSQETSADVIEEAIRMRASGYVNKAKIARDLVTAIEMALEGKRFFTAGLLSAPDLQALTAEE